MRKDSFSKLKAFLKKINNVVIVTHWSPDGDAIGSSLGLYHYLKAIGKKVSVVVPNEYPDFLKWMPGDKQILNFEKDATKVGNLILKAEAIFTLDFNTLKRIEELGKEIEIAKAPKILVDHHQQPDDYATYYFHDVDACSTCELVYDLIVGLGDKKLIDKKIAQCLYVGLMTDTGSFRYSSVNSKTHIILSELLKTGILPSEIHSAVYDTYSEDRVKLLGYAISEKMTILKGLPIAYISLTGEELKKFNYVKGDTEGLVNYPFQVKGIRVCALFNEMDGTVKISFRSKGNIDVNKFARSYFNGGGHINAAGGRSHDSLGQTIQKFVELAPTLIKK